MELKRPVRPPRWYRGGVEGPRLSLITIRKLRCGAAAVEIGRRTIRSSAAEDMRSEDRGVKVIDQDPRPCHSGQCAAITAETRAAKAQTMKPSSPTVRHSIGQTGQYGPQTLDLIGIADHQGDRDDGQAARDSAQSHRR